jgi:uncharacterized protein (TIGR03905 family)
VDFSPRSFQREGFLLKSAKENERYVYRTRGVCPPEIHFEVQDGLLTEVRFVGGGCPGNAKLVSRLVEGLPTERVMEFLRGIECRNETSCPDQLLKALSEVGNGSLQPAHSFGVHVDSRPRKSIALIGELGGRVDVLRRLIEDISGQNVETSYCLGNLTGHSPANKDLLEFLRKQGILAIQGDVDWSYGQGTESDGLPSLEQKERDYLFLLPHVLSFQVGEKRGMAFFGEYLQRMSGFSDFDPFALEVNMVCSLTQFFKDETVLPALEAMVPHFRARIILFSQPKKWGHWQVGSANFISVGSAETADGLNWGLLKGDGEEIHFEIMQPRN